jgi:SAM-dependent methyltransferase
MPPRGLLFGSVAESYERFRLGYPEELADTIVQYASSPLQLALEVGAGTGKATRLLAARGVSITACEPDPQMAALLARQVRNLDVTVVPTSYEEFSSSARFDLLYATAAWHWTDPATRWDRAVCLVRPGGTLAFAAAPPSLADPDLQAEVDLVRMSRIPPEAVHPAPTGTLGGWHWPGSEIADDPRFTDLRELVLPRRVRVTAEHYLGYLATVSAYLQLPVAEAEDLLDRIQAVLPDEVDLEASVWVHLARTVPDGV